MGVAFSPSHLPTVRGVSTSKLTLAELPSWTDIHRVPLSPFPPFVKATGRSPAHQRSANLSSCAIFALLPPDLLPFNKSDALCSIPVIFKTKTPARLPPKATAVSPCGLTGGALIGCFNMIAQYTGPFVLSSIKQNNTNHKFRANTSGKTIK